MKKILLVDSSPRKDGNSDVIVSLLAEQLKDAEVTMFKMREHKCNPMLSMWLVSGKRYGCRLCTKG
jgi:multimeric flavodoxin WrbA